MVNTFWNTFSNTVFGFISVDSGDEYEMISIKCVCSNNVVNGYSFINSV